MIAWISPGFSSRLIPLRIGLPSTVAWRFSIRSMRLILGRPDRLPGGVWEEGPRFGHGADEAIDACQYGFDVGRPFCPGTASLIPQCSVSIPGSLLPTRTAVSSF